MSIRSSGKLKFYRMKIEYGLSVGHVIEFPFDSVLEEIELSWRVSSDPDFIFCQVEAYNDLSADDGELLGPTNNIAGLFSFEAQLTTQKLLKVHPGALDMNFVLATLQESMANDVSVPKELLMTLMMQDAVVAAEEIVRDSTHLSFRLSLPLTTNLILIFNRHTKSGTSLLSLDVLLTLLPPLHRAQWNSMERQDFCTRFPPRPIVSWLSAMPCIVMPPNYRDTFHTFEVQPIHPLDPSGPAKEARKADLIDPTGRVVEIALSTPREPSGHPIWIKKYWTRSRPSLQTMVASEWTLQGSTRRILL
jgi:hypothetical protein